MAAVLHLVDQRRLIDSNGISDGGSIAFYTTGTLTPITIYSDAGLTTPLANPVVVAAGAAVPDIYWDDSLTVRRIITYADGSTDDTDPYTLPAYLTEAASSASAAAASATAAASSATAAATSASSAAASTLEYLPVMDQLRYVMSQQRVDFVGIGDSNQVFSGHGWDRGFQKALIDMGYQMYATGLISVNENSASGGGTGYGYAFNGSQPLIGATTGAPAALDDLWDKGTGGGTLHYYSYLSSGTFAAGNNSGLTLSNSPDVLDITAELDYHVWWGGFTTGSGSFATAVRLNASPFTELITSSVTNTNTGSNTLNQLTITVPADAGRTAGLNGKYTKVGTDITAPWFGLWQRFENPARTTGFSYSTLVYRGGEGTRTAAVDLQQLSDNSLTEYFTILRDGQPTSRKVICFCINEGLNDRNETLTSVGPAAETDPDSAEAFVDNHTAIVERIEAIWDANGWPKTEINWLVFPSHPISDPDDSELISYRTAVRNYFLNDVQRSQVIDIAALTDEAEMLSEGWYASSGSDRNHLTQTGYEQISLKVLGEAQ